MKRLLTALLLLLLPAAPASASACVQPPAVGRYTSPGAGPVNIQWISAPRGLIVIDAGRDPSQTRHAVDAIRATGRPVLAIVITHAHPDHVGGLGVLHKAFPSAPMYASAATIEEVRTDSKGFYALTRSFDPDYPKHMTVPDHVNPCPSAALCWRPRSSGPAKPTRRQRSTTPRPASSSQATSWRTT